MLKICLAFWKSEPQYAYKHYAYRKTCIPAVKKSLQGRNTSLQKLNILLWFYYDFNFNWG